jgi:hypothetical protein
LEGSWVRCEPAFRIAAEKGKKNGIREARMKYTIGVELLERELISIGRIVALWGSLEHEIFCQTLICFDVTSPGQLPKEMNNMQFSSVLELWDSHVVSKATAKRKQVLQEQYKKIGHYHDFRNALVHGMWDLSKDKPAKITATRLRRAEVIRTHFTVDDLEDLASELETINFNVRSAVLTNSQGQSQGRAHLLAAWAPSW